MVDTELLQDAARREYAQAQAHKSKIADSIAISNADNIDKK